MKVAGVKPRNKGSMVKLEREDGATIEVWCSADKATVEAWNGIVPAEFDLRQKRDSSEQILVEKQRQGGAYAQSKEAFDRSAESRLAWQREEEDRKDRRTALMTAFERNPNIKEGLEVASRMYRWLRNPDGATSRPTAAPSGRSGEAPSQKSSLEHHPGGAVPAGRQVPSEEVPSTASSGHYPVDPTTCDHKRANGRPAKFTDAENVERCQKCGLPWIVVVEGTTQDLGAAT